MIDTPTRPPPIDSESDPSGRSGATGSLRAVVERLSRPGTAALALGGLLAAHRALLVTLHGDALRALVAANPDRLLAQFLEREALWLLPARSLLHLQQTPPVPNALMAGLLAVFEWPMQVTWALLSIQATITLAVAWLLARLGDRLRSGVGLALGALWILSPDVVVLEAHSFGQLLHESLATLLVLGSVVLLVRLVDRPDARESMLGVSTLGLLAGLLALTRASYAYVALPLGALVVLLPMLGARGRRGWNRRLAAFALPWLLLHGGWVVKNAIVHDDLRLAPSTWAGANAASGLVATGQREELLRSIEASDELPPWFQRFARATEAMPWAGGWGEDEALLPAELRRRDIVRQQHLRGTDRAENGIRQRVVADLYLDAWRGYIAERPAALAHKAQLGYALYWFPIRYHGTQEVGLFSVDWRVERSLRWHRSVGLLLAGRIPEPARVTSGSWPELERRPARLYTLDLPITLWWLLTFPAIHVGVPLLLVVLAVRLARGGRVRVDDLRERLRAAFLVAATTLYGYAAVVHSVVDQGENMRFRITTEPLIWLLTALVLVKVTESIATATRRVAGRASRPSDADDAPRADAR